LARKQTWTDEQLRAAVASSSTYFMVLRTLGLSGRGGCHWTVRQRVAQLGLDTNHFKQSSRRRMPWTDQSLGEAVGSSKNWIEVLKRFGLEPGGGRHEKVRRDARNLGLDTSHFVRKRGLHDVRVTRWSDDQLRSALATSLSYAGAIRLLGLVPAGGNYDAVKRRARELGLDTSHFTGQGWNTGGKFIPRPARDLDEVLVANRPTSSHLLKQRLFREGLKERKCELCGWAQCAPDGRLPLELDHINGDKTDNRLVNLRVLCPNCHALQPTHRGLNKQSRRNRT
jgi:hypothetical protein